MYVSRLQPVLVLVSSQTNLDDDGILSPMRAHAPFKALQAVLCCLYHDHGALDKGSRAGCIHSAGKESMASYQAWAILM